LSHQGKREKGRAPRGDSFYEKSGRGDDPCGRAHARTSPYPREKGGKLEKPTATLKGERRNISTKDPRDQIRNLLGAKENQKAPCKRGKALLLGVHSGGLKGYGPEEGRRKRLGDTKKKTREFSEDTGGK